MKPTTVILAEDHAVLREGLRTLLELQKGIRVIAEAKDGREAVRYARTLKPNVVVMDLAMPRLNGFEATRQILRYVPETKVLVLSAHCEDEYVSHLISLGCSGYLAKQSSGQVLVRAIREVIRGRNFFSAPRPGLFPRSGARQASQLESRVIMDSSLTSRESEVLQLVAEGVPNKRIATELDISIKTVEKHRQQLMDKLGIHDTAGLTRHAIATGVIETHASLRLP